MTHTNNTGSINWRSAEMTRRVQKRYRKERRFRLLGLSAVLMTTAFLLLLIGTIGSNGILGFFQTYIKLDVPIERATFASLTDTESAQTLDQIYSRADYAGMINSALYATFPDVTDRRAKRRLRGILSPGVRTKIRDMVLKDPGIIGTTQTLWLLASDDIDQLQKGKIDRTTPEETRRVKDRELDWVDTLTAKDAIKVRFHSDFFTAADSRDPENVGIWGATVGTALTLAVTLALAFPVGVAAAVYLEEFAPENRFTDFIEININNLAAVPSIVFGLLGLAVFLGTFNLPRSAPLVGGLTLALMTLPTVIIAARAAIKAVPPSIRDAAYALGASNTQVVFHHVLPPAMPGILTGTIIGMAQALGETAPLLMIGMVAFVVDIPGSVMDAATALPVQIFIWANSPERLFIEKASAAILVLLAFLIAMNALAIWLRNKFETRW